MMMGTAGELPKPPEKPTQFLEDMTDAQVAEAVRMMHGDVDTCFSHLHCIARDPCWLGESWQYMLHGMLDEYVLCVSLLMTSLVRIRLFNAFVPCLNFKMISIGR